MKTRTQTQHTPGPWTFEDGTLRSVPNIKERMIVSLSPEMGQEANANARLIAAAPELLSALMEALYWNENDIKGFEDIVPDLEMLKNRSRVLKAAIAKAEGKGE